MIRRVPLGLIGMLALVAAVESLVAARGEALLPIDTWAWRHAAKAARSEATSCRVLAFGDSQVMMGVVPDRLSATGRPATTAYNLAVPGGQAPTSYFLLRRAIDAGARPKAVVVDFIPTLLDCEISYNAKRWPEALGPRDALDLAREAGDPARFGATLLPQLLPSLRARDAIRDAAGAASRGKSPSREARLERRLAEGTIRRNQETNRGALVAAEHMPPPSPEDVSRWYATSYPRPWTCRPLQEAYVRRFLDLAESRGIAVYWLLPPLYPEAGAMTESRGDAARYTRFVLAMTADYPDVTVLDARGSGYGPETFFDIVHLKRRGALALTAEIGEAVARGRDGRRWVELGPYREPDAGPVEDTGVSRRVVRAKLARERVVR